MKVADAWIHAPPPPAPATIHHLICPWPDSWPLEHSFFLPLPQQQLVLAAQDDGQKHTWCLQWFLYAYICPGSWCSIMDDWGPTEQTPGYSYAWHCADIHILGYGCELFAYHSELQEVHAMFLGLLPTWHSVTLFWSHLVHWHHAICEQACLSGHNLMDHQFCHIWVACTKSTRECTQSENLSVTNVLCCHLWLPRFPSEHYYPCWWWVQGAQRMACGPRGQAWMSAPMMNRIPEIEHFICMVKKHSHGVQFSPFPMLFHSYDQWNGHSMCRFIWTCFLPMMGWLPHT